MRVCNCAQIDIRVCKILVYFVNFVIKYMCKQRRYPVHILYPIPW